MERSPYTKCSEGDIEVESTCLAVVKELYLNDNPSQMGATTTLMDDVLQLDHDGPKDLGEDHIVHLTSGR